MKKRNLRIYIFIVIILTLIGLYIFGRIYYTETKLIERDYDIDLPDNMKIEYKISSVGWFGEGERYIVYKLNQEPTEFINDFSKWTNPEFKTTFEKSIIPLDIPKDYLPDWYYNYYWKTLEKHGYLYMIYFPSSLTLIIFQVRE